MFALLGCFPLPKDRRLSCQMLVASDSAVCRNLRGWIPAAGTLCATNHHVPDRQRYWQWEDTGLKEAGCVDTKGLTFSWSWTLAPFFNKVSTTLECPYWEATVRAVPPSCHEKTKEKQATSEKNSQQWPLCVTCCRENISKVSSGVKKQPEQHVFFASFLSPYLYTKHSESQSAVIASQQQPPSHPVLWRLWTHIIVPRCIPLSGIQWRHRIQRGASPRHCGPAGRRRTGR